MPHGQLGDRARHESGRDRRQACHRDHAAPMRRDIVRVLDDRLDLEQHPLEGRDQFAAGLGERDVPVVPIEQA
jgi:hypothetical protein